MAQYGAVLNEPIFQSQFGSFWHTAAHACFPYGYTRTYVEPMTCHQMVAWLWLSENMAQDGAERLRNGSNLELKRASDCILASD